MLKVCKSLTFLVVSAMVVIMTNNPVPFWLDDIVRFKSDNIEGRVISVRMGGGYVRTTETKELVSFKWDDLELITPGKRP
jgi:hypothetical protein